MHTSITVDVLFVIVNVLLDVLAAITTPDFSISFITAPAEFIMYKPPDVESAVLGVKHIRVGTPL